MSDIEGQCLETAPSICSDLDQEVASQVRSLSSIDFIQRQGHAHKTAMNGSSEFKGFLPGRQRPPHHQYGHSSQQGSTRPPPVPPLKREPSTHQWSFDMSESVSGDTGSPRKEKSEVPVISLRSKPSTTENNGQAGDDDIDVQRNMADEDPVDEGDRTPLEKTKKSRPYSRERKKRKSQRRKDSESLAMQDVASAKTEPQVTESLDYASTSMEPVQESRRQSRTRKQRPEASSVQSTGTYTIEGVENPAFSDSETQDRVVLRRGNVQQPQAPTSSRDTLQTAMPVSEDEVEASNHADFKVQRESTMSLATQKSRSMHAATVCNSAMNSETRRLVNQSYTAAYICENIKQRECNVYARNSKSSSNDCQCGRSVEWHREKGLDVNLGTDRIKWHPKTHTELMPCDSFGEILFRGFGSQADNSPYMRVDHVCDPAKVWTVLMDCWQLPVPRLLISVTGGAKRFYLRPRLKNILKQGLVSAAVSTGAWIVTGGTATGVMEFVGEAVQDHIQASGGPGQNECVALGIASWGAVANNLALDGEGEHGLFPATYCMEDIDMKKHKCAPLDHNHTHFLLVDDGTEGKYGVEIEFRSKLEKYISEEVETGVAEKQSVNVPSVLIVVEGGINTMKTVQQSIRRKIPVVIIDGSGRCADFIAYAYRFTKNPHDEDSTVFPLGFKKAMTKVARDAFEWNKHMNEEDIQLNIIDALSFLEDCLKDRRLINIFNLDKADSVKDIDRAILYALLKANKSDVRSQLALALAWNRCDIARQEIFTAENRHKWEQAELYDAMFTALVQNRADFVQLFLDNGVDLKRFLTTRTLWNLYCNCITNKTDAGASLLRYLISYLKQTWAAFLLCRGTPDFENFPDLLPYINKVIIHLLQDQSFQFYTDERLVVNEEVTMTWKGDEDMVKPMSSRISSRKSMPDIDEILSATDHGQLSRRRTKQKFLEHFDFDYPERELFIWAVLFNRRQLTHLFWRIGHDHLGGALFASALLYRLSELADGEEEAELSRDMALHSDECEGWAVSVLSECYSRDKQLTHRLLVRELKHWGKVTLFKMAESYELMDFAEHSACQTKLTSIWKGRMALYTSEMKILICAMLPILVPFIKFTIDPKDKNEEENDFMPEVEIPEDGKPASPGRSPQNKNRVGPHGLPDTDGDGLGFVRSQTRRRDRSLATKFRKVNLFDFTTDNINIVFAIYYFYQAPVTKLFANILSYMVFTGLFSYFVLVQLAPTDEKDSPSLEEYLTWVWCGTMMLEEIRQLFIRDQHSLKYKFRSWFSNLWNRFDATMYALFILSIVLRYQLSGESFVWARITYSITLAMFFLRFMQYFYAEKNMGPKVIMIRKMLTDLMFFFFILLVFVVSFGVAYHANMFPQTPASWSILVNVLYFPYFQMYGELFLEDMKGEDVGSCTRNETIWREDPFKRCPTENAIVPMLLAVYMILTNILLVNLLIAMFSYTFQTVQDNSTKVWRYYRLSLVSEYFDRPSLVPPIIVINHIFRLLRWIVYKKTKKGKRPNSFRWELDPQEQNRLTMFEKSAMEHHLSISKQQLKLTLDSRVKNTAKRLDTVMEELQMIRDSIQQQDHARQSFLPPAQYDSGGDGTVAELQRERELMERSPLVTAVPLRSESQEQRQSEEMEKLNKTVEGVASQSAAMSQRLSQLTLLLEQSVAEQQAFIRSQKHKQSGGVQEVTEVWQDDSTSEA